MVDMNERISHFSVELLEIEPQSQSYPCRSIHFARATRLRHIGLPSLAFSNPRVFPPRRYKFGKETVRLHIVPDC